MPESTLPLDPLAVWRDMISQWEKGTNQFVNQASASDAYNEGMHKAMGASLTAKKMSDDLVKRYLLAFNLPSRDDVEALGERLQAIEDRLIGIATALDTMSGGLVTSTTLSPVRSIAAPRRTKRPPTEEPPAAIAPPPAKKTRKGRR